MKYSYKPIDEVREDVIGLRIIDVEAKGSILHLESEQGRSFCIDFTGDDGAVVHKGPTPVEELENLRTVLNFLMRHFDIDEDELWEKYYV